MAVKTAYTLTEFEDYLDVELGPVADALGWSTSNDDYDEAINDALNMFGASDITDISGAAGIDKIRILGKLAIWRRVAEHASGDYDFSVDAGSYKRSQFAAMAEKRVKTYERRAARWLHPIRVRTVAHIHDPYEYRTDEDRPL